MATENIPSRLHSVAQGNVVTGANEILDDDKNKKQNVINQENDQRLDTLEAAVGTGGSVDSRIESAKTEIVGGASSDCNTLGKAEALISTNANDIAALQEAYAALTQNDVVVVAPSDTWPVATPAQNTIYRVVDRTNTPPQYYADYMWNGTVFVEMARYNNAIDAVPTAGSHNLVESGGVQNELALGAVYDVTAHNSNATFDSLEALLSDANLNTLIPTSVRKGGMSIKFVQSSDNKYVQYRLVSDTFTTTESEWQKQGAEVSVSQNTSTGHTDINVGGTAYPVASVEDIFKLSEDMCGPLKVNYWYGSGGGIVTDNVTGLVILLRKTDTVIIKGNVSYGSRYAYITDPINPTLCPGTSVTNIGTSTVTVPPLTHDCYLWISNTYNAEIWTPSYIEKNGTNILNSTINDRCFKGIYKSANRNSVLTDGIYKCFENNYILFVYSIDSIKYQIEIGAYGEISAGVPQFVCRQRTYSGGTWSSWGNLLDPIKNSITTLSNSVGNIDNRVTGIEGDLYGLVPQNVWFNSQGERTTTTPSTGYLIPLSTSDTIKVQAANSWVRCVLLTSESATSGTLTQINAESSSTFSNPSTDSFLWISDTYDTGDYKELHRPISIVKNGAEMLRGGEIPSNVYVSYNNSDKTFKVYRRIGKSDKFFMYIIGLRYDISELIYQNVWGLMGGSLCKYNNGVFSEELSNIMLSAENEFAFKCQNTSDFTGGYHGDERVDIENTSFVKFLINGCPISVADLQSDYEVWCDSFSYIEYSTLHATSEDGVTPIADHPIIARHYKEVDINERVKIRNIVKFVTALSIQTYFSGLFCMGKAFATTAEVSGQLFNATGSDMAYTASDTLADRVLFYNENNAVGASVDSSVKRRNFTAQLTPSCSIWDRTNDTKYYRYLGQFNVVSGDTIETETIVEYKA